MNPTLIYDFQSLLSELFIEKRTWSQSHKVLLCIAKLLVPSGLFTEKRKSFYRSSVFSGFIAFALKMNVKFSRSSLSTRGVKHWIFLDLEVVLSWYLRWVMFRVQKTFSKILVNKWSLLFQKGTQVRGFTFF